MTPRDKAIRDTLTGQPQWIEEWQEYAAVADDGALYTAETGTQCKMLVHEANAVIAAAKRRAADAVADGWAQYEKAAQQARENAEAWMAEIKANNETPLS